MNTVTKSELIEALASEQLHLAHKDVEYSVNTLLEKMGDALMSGRRIEIRGFGSISLRYRGSRVGRNPKTGAAVTVPEKYVPPAEIGTTLNTLNNRRISKIMEQLSMLQFVPVPISIPALAGPCTPGLALHSPHSYGYGIRSSAAPSRTCPAPASGMLVKHRPGLLQGRAARPGGGSFPRTHRDR